MKIDLKGTITYEVEIDDKLIKPGFDLEKWAKEEFGRQCEAFIPDEVDYSGYEVVKNND